MRYLSPKTDYAFRKIFGSDESRDILISFLNAILELKGAEEIVSATVLDPRLVPKIEGMKDTYLDVRVKDQRGRSYIVEMQVLNYEGFEKRVLYNACKAYAGQLGRGDEYHQLTEVIAVTITDFIMFPELTRVVSRFRLRADENPAICHQDLELVFAELPKFTTLADDVDTPLERWLYFLKSARTLDAIPPTLANDAAIRHAFDIANCGAWSELELIELEKREMWISDQRRVLGKLKLVEAMEGRLREKEEKLQDIEGKLQDTEGKLQDTEGKLQDTEGKLQDTEGKLQDTRGKLQDTRGKLQDTRGKLEEKGQQLQDITNRLRDAERKVRKEKLRGKVDLLLRQLHKRFGALTEEDASRVLGADEFLLDLWSDRIFDVDTLADLFASSPPP